MDILIQDVPMRSTGHPSDVHSSRKMLFNQINFPFNKISPYYWINNKDVSSILLSITLTHGYFNPGNAQDVPMRSAVLCPQFSKDVVRGRLHSVIDRYRCQVSTTLPCSMHVPQKCWHGNELAYPNQPVMSGAANKPAGNYTVLYGLNKFLYPKLHRKREHCSWPKFEIESFM